MGTIAAIHKGAVTAFFAGLLVALPLHAQDDPEADLLRRLADPATQDSGRVESDIQRLWSHSGSATMDLLLKRGRDAMEEGDIDAAIEHLTALTDHAPDFAEGWNARATAFYIAGLFGPSIDDIRRTLAINPNHYGALAGLGMIMEALGDDGRAIWAYKASVAINPHQPRVQESLERLEQKSEGTKI